MMIASLFKKCKSCGINKPLNEFYKHSQMGDGHLNICIECKKNYTKNYRLENIEKVMEYDRNRPNKIERTIKNKARINSNEFIKKILQASKTAWRKRNKDKVKCHNAVKRAINNGTLIKPSLCDVCNANTELQAHHSDYSKPLEVIWVCQKCHSVMHKNIREFNRENVKMAS